MKKAISVFSMILLVISMVGCSDKQIYGNDNESIIQYLYESDLLEGIGKQNISIVDTAYIENSKIVGFSTDSGQGVLVFEKDEKGNYVRKDARANGINGNNIGVTTYMIRYNNYNDLENSDRAYIVVSNGEVVSNVELVLNDKYKTSKYMKIGTPSMVMIKEELPYNELSYIKIDWKYFDMNNNEISQNN